MGIENLSEGVTDIDLMTIAQTNVYKPLPAIQGEYYIDSRRSDAIDNSNMGGANGRYWFYPFFPDFTFNPQSVGLICNTAVVQTFCLYLFNTDLLTGRASGQIFNTGEIGISGANFYSTSNVFVKSNPTSILLNTIEIKQNVKYYIGLWIKTSSFINMRVGISYPISTTNNTGDTRNYCYRVTSSLTTAQLDIDSAEDITSITASDSTTSKGALIYWGIGI